MARARTRNREPGTSNDELRTTNHERLPQIERELDGDARGNGLPQAPAGIEAPSPNGVDGFLIQAESRVERLDHVDASDRAVGEDENVEFDHAFDLGTHGVRRVVGLDLADQPRPGHAVAGPPSLAAGAGARTIGVAKSIAVGTADTRAAPTVGPWSCARTSRRQFDWAELRYRANDFLQACRVASPEYPSAEPGRQPAVCSSS